MEPGGCVIRSEKVLSGTRQNRKPLKTTRELLGKFTFSLRTSLAEERKLIYYLEILWFGGIRNTTLMIATFVSDMSVGNNHKIQKLTSNSGSILSAICPIPHGRNVPVPLPLIELPVILSDPPDSDSSTSSRLGYRI
ncbi:hypothetical protein NPIL_651711 [Nephila pilipes]|uniref:Uncharacterized protein n=1 Tax=Nephila pilipes TaxID=299642 RepID=A0A8X6TGK3_NEPPI|nr:hypothetical protein NPIL_651711 [Nephila pilipes]